MGDVNVSGWVCVVCDIVKRVWERIETHDLSPQVVSRRPTEQVHPESDLHSAGAPQKGPKCPPTIVYLSLRLCSVLLHYLFSFSVNHGNSDPSVKTAPGINSISDEGFLFWPMARRQSRLSANHHLQLEKFLFTFNDLTKKNLFFNWTQTAGVSGDVPSHTITFHPLILYGTLFPSVGRWSRWCMKCSVTCNPCPVYKLENKRGCSWQALLTLSNCTPDRHVCF